MLISNLNTTPDPSKKDWSNWLSALGGLDKKKTTLQGFGPGVGWFSCQQNEMAPAWSFDRGGSRQLLIEKGRRILRKFCASEEGRRKLERHRARQKKSEGPRAGSAGTAQLDDGQNTPRAISDWQRSLISPPRGGLRSEIPQEAAAAAESPWLAVRSTVLGALAQLENAVDSADSLHATSTHTTPAKRGSSSRVLGKGAPASSARSGHARHRSRIAEHEDWDDVLDAAGTMTCSSCRGPNSELSLLRQRLAAKQRELDQSLSQASEAEKRAQEEGLEVAMELLEGEIAEAKAETAGWQREAERWQAAAESESRRAERAIAEAGRSAEAERSAREQLSEAVSTMGRELAEARQTGERMAVEAIGWWDDWEAAASAVAGAFDSASQRAKIAADAAALEISTLKLMLREAQELRSKEAPCISSPAQTPADTGCDPSDAHPYLESSGNSNVGGRDGGHGSGKLTQRAAAAAAARVHLLSCGDSGVCAGDALSRDRLQPPLADSSPRIGGRYWRKLSEALAPKINGTYCVSSSPSMANPALLLSPTSFRGSSPEFSIGLQGSAASLGGKRVPAGCNPWERAGGAPARMLAPPDGPERRERAQAGWGK